jgi:3-oxoacyl-[acyl-carrier protein] reductase
VSPLSRTPDGAISRKLLPKLSESDAGSIVFMSSVANTITGLPAEMCPYSAMKAALIAHAGQLAQAAGGAGVRVNAVSPGPILFKGGTSDAVRETNPEAFAQTVASTALGRMGDPREVARVVAFLASPAASCDPGAETCAVEPPRCESTASSDVLGM